MYSIYQWIYDHLEAISRVLNDEGKDYAKIEFGEWICIFVKKRLWYNWSGGSFTRRIYGLGKLHGVFGSYRQAGFTAGRCVRQGKERRVRKVPRLRYHVFPQSPFTLRRQENRRKEGMSHEWNALLGVWQVCQNPVVCGNNKLQQRQQLHRVLVQSPVLR